MLLQFHIWLWMVSLGMMSLLLQLLNVTIDVCYGFCPRVFFSKFNIDIVKNNIIVSIATIVTYCQNIARVEYTHLDM